MNDTYNGFLKKFDRPHRTYIVPRPFGFAFAALTIFTFAMALVYSNNLVYGMVFFIVSFSIQNMIRCSKNIEKTCFESAYIEPFFQNEKGQLHLELKSIAPWKIYNIQLSHPEFTDVVPIDSIESKDSIKKQIEIKSPDRGYHSLNHIKIQSTFPFEFFRSWKKINSSVEYLVYPRKTGSSLFGTFKNAAKNITNDEFQNHEEYNNSSSLNRVDWKVYARTNDLYVKKYSSTVDVNTDFSWEQVQYLTGFEDQISQLTLWIYEAHANQLEFSLSLPQKFFPKSRTLEHYHTCLKELALCKP